MKLPSWASRLTECQRKALRHQREDMRIAEMDDSVICCHPDHKPFVIRPSGEIVVIESDVATIVRYQPIFIGDSPNRIQWTRPLDPGIW